MNILVPKSKENIIKDLSNLSQEKKDKKLLDISWNCNNEVKLELVKVLIEAGAYINTKDYRGDTALIIASRTNQLELAKLLIKMGIKINTKNNSKFTALGYASIYNHIEIVKLLKANKI
jgi:ankyrin repeat protein